MPLSVGIQAKFAWGNLFGTNLIDCPMECKLLINKEYYFIYVNLCDQVIKTSEISEHTSGLDVFKILNKAFKCQWPEGFLVVDSAGFFRYAKINEANTNKNNTKIEEIQGVPSTDLAIPDSIIKEATMGCTCFWLTIALNTEHTPSIFRRLIDVGYHGVAEISMLAKLNQEKEPEQAINEMSLEAKLNQITLLNFFVFDNLQLRYACGKNKELELCGNIHMTIGDNPYIFSGDVKINEQELIADISGGKENATIQDIFSEQMGGLILESISFHLFYAFDKHQKIESEANKLIWWLQGTINYSQTIQFTGQLFMMGSKPLFARILIEKYALSISELIKRFITHDDEGWPDEFINIVFLEGSQLYYLTEETTALTEIDKAVNFEKGFNIFAKMQVTLFKPIEIAGNINISSAGVKATIQLENEIDLYILQIKGKNGIKGPYFSISTIGENHMQFAGNISFFNEEFGYVGICCGKDNKGNLKIEGELKLSESLKKLLGADKEVRLKVSYCKEQGFKIDNWPDLVSDELDIVKQLKEVIQSKGKKCDEIGDFLYEKYVKTKFQLSPTIHVSEDQTSKQEIFKFGVGGKYVLTFGQEEIVCLDFPNAIEFEISKEMTFESVMKNIIKVIGKSIGSFIEDLLKEEHAEELGKLIIVLAGKEAADKIFSLLCRRLISETVARGMIEASVAFTATAVAIESQGESAIIAAGIASVSVIIGKWLHNEKKSEEEEKRENEKKDREKKKNPDDVDYKPEAPTDFKVVCSETNITLTWNYVVGATGYEIFWSDGINERRERLNNKCTYIIQLNEKESNPDSIKTDFELCYTIEIASYYGDKKSEVIKYELYRLSSPKLKVEYSEDSGIRAQWESVQDAVGYKIIIEVQGKKEEKIIEETHYCIQTTSINNQEAVVYHISVQAMGKCSWLSSKMAEETVIIEPKIIKTLSQVIQESYEGGEKSTVCINKALEAYPDTQMIDIALIMKQVGYLQEEIIKSIKLVKPDITVKDITIIMIRLSDEKPQSVEELAKHLYETHRTKEECVKLIMEAYPNISILEMANAMKNAGYLIQEIIEAIKAVRTEISAKELVKIMIELDK